MARHLKTQGDRIAKGLTWRQLVELDACTRCGECQVWCPVYARDSRELITARSKIQSLRSLVRDRLGEAEHEEFISSLYECSACGQCHVVCPVRINTPELWEQSRASLVQAGIPQPEDQIRQLSAIKEFNNSYSRPQQERGLWADKAWESGLLIKPLRLWKEHPSPVLYFAGCTASYEPSQQAVAVQSARLLQEAGIDFSILGSDEPCCASKLRRMGDSDFLREAGRRTAMIREMGIKTIVVSCAGCYKGLHSDYAGIWSDAPHVLHLTQFLDLLIRDGRLLLRHEVPLTATYHDPCHLGRHNNVYDEPRRMLRAIPGLRLVEMPRHRSFSSCCGMGGGLKLAFPGIQLKMSAGRIREAEETGADAVVTPCQTCAMGLQHAADEISSPVKVYHSNEILIRSVCPDVSREAVVEAFSRH